MLPSEIAWYSALFFCIFSTHFRVSAKGDQICLAYLVRGDQIRGGGPNPRLHRRAECNKDFAHQSTMIAHMKKCNKRELMRPEKQVLTCPHVFCKQKNKVFSSAYNLKRHIKICKPKVQPVHHICMEPYCGRRFEKACLLARHVETHSKPTYVCERCWTEYKRPDKFASHQQHCNVAPVITVSNGQESGSAAVPTVDG